MRIAIVRLTSLGDVVHTLPVAAAVRSARPDARVTWIVEEHEQILLWNNPIVDDIIVAPLRRWRELVVRGRLTRVTREVRAFARAVRSRAIDVAIDVQGWAHKTSPIVLLTGARIRIGFDRHHARDPWSPIFTTCHVVPDPAAAHVVDQNLALLGPLGIEPTTPAFVLPPWPGSTERVEAWMAAHDIAAESLIVLLPSTRGRRKLWPAASYAALAARLSSQHDGGRVVLAGGPDDRAVFDAVRAHRPDLLVFAPDAVGDLAVFLGHASLVIGNDTGPLHLAAAAEVPTVGLFGPTSGARNGPYGATGFFVQSRTGRMADIPVDAAFDQAVRAMKTRRERR